MPTFTSQVQNLQPLLVATIVKDGANHNYNALLDTGAQMTALSPKVVEEVELKAIGHDYLVPASGQPIQTTKHRVNLSIAIQQGPAVLMSGRELDVLCLPFQPDNFEIILGMDFLANFHVTMHNNFFILSN